MNKLNKTTIASLTMILVITIATIVYIAWGPEPNSDNTGYLLSTLSQSLAAVLALVFTISLIIIQLNSRYSFRMLVRFFDWVTISYISLFVISVVIPYILLSHESVILTKVAIGLGIICLFLLVPYYLRFREKLNPLAILDFEKDMALKKITIRSKDYINHIVAAQNTIMVTVEERDYDTFTKGIEDLGDICLEAYSVNREDVGEELLNRLIEIEECVIEKPRGSYYLIEVFNALVKRAIEEKNIGLLQTMANVNFASAKICCKNRREDLACNNVEAIDKIQKMFITDNKYDDWIAENVISRLADIVRNDCINEGLWKTGIKIIDVLSNMGPELIKSKMKKSIGYCEYELRVLLVIIGETNAAQAAERGVNISKRGIIPPLEISYQDEKELGYEIQIGLTILANTAMNELMKTESEDILGLNHIVSMSATSIASIGTQSVRDLLPEAAYIFTSDICDLGKKSAEKNMPLTTNILYDLKNIVEEKT